MAGHSHAKNVMHHKGAQDARRARQFAKLIREITVAAKQGLPDPAANARLRAAVATAYKQNMSKDAVDRAIKKASGATAGEDFSEIRYEGYGPSGVAVIVEALTDNRNRTASDVRSAFNKYGGAMGETNSVSFMFTRMGVVTYGPRAATPDAMLDAAIEAGADDVASDAEGHEVLCGPDTLFAVRDALEQRFGAPEEAKFDWRPSTTVTLDEERAAIVLKLIDALEENDDVQTVFANYDIPDEVLSRIAG